MYFCLIIYLFSGREASGSGWKADPWAGRGQADPGGPEDGAAAGPGGRGDRDHAQERGERVGEGPQARGPRGAGGRAAGRMRAV